MGLDEEKIKRYVRYQEDKERLERKSTKKQASFKRPGLKPPLPQPILFVGSLSLPSLGWIRRKSDGR